MAVLSLLHLLLFMMFVFLILLQLSDAGRAAKVPISNKSNPIRQTIWGSVKGQIWKGLGLKAEVYRSIPYAKPPVGDLRFQRSQNPDSWTGVKDATQLPSNCVQFWYATKSGNKSTEEANEDEDCLYLSVYIPIKEKRSDRKYPVLVWLHGGSYTVGGLSNFPANEIVNRLVSRGIIFVVINYRLGPLGFLSMLNESCSGNFGLSDQLQALTWVNQNIANFGGDPNRVTLGGESAGGSAASMLAASPKSKGLVHRLIVRSGSSLTPWALRSRNTDFNSMTLLSQTLCRNQANVQLTMECLRHNTSITELKHGWSVIAHDDLKAMSNLNHTPQHYNHPFFAHTYFTPVVDRFMQSDSIVPEYANDLLKKYASIPLMIGYVSAESIGYGMLVAKVITSDCDMRRLSCISVFAVDFGALEIDPGVQVQSATVRKYIEPSEYMNAAKAIGKIIKVCSDQKFVAPILAEAEIYARKGNDVYLYNFDYWNSAIENRYSLEYGLQNMSFSPHGTDMLFLLRSAQATTGHDWSPKFNEEDEQVSASLASDTAKFVRGKNLEQTGTRKAWPKFKPYEWSTHKRYTSPRNLKPPGFHEKSMRDSYTFWREIVPVLDGAIFRTDCEYCQDSTNLWRPTKPPNTEPASPVEFSFRYPFFIAMACCTLLIFSTCALAFLHFGKSKHAL